MINLYSIMDYLDSKQAIIEVIGNVAIVVFIVICVLVYLLSCNKRFTEGWKKWQQEEFWREIRRNG